MLGKQQGWKKINALNFHLETKQHIFQNKAEGRYNKEINEAENRCAIKKMKCQKEKINKTDKPLDRLLIRERKRNEKGYISTGPTSIKC